MNRNSHFDNFAATYDKNKPKYYYGLVKKIYLGHIPPGKNILDIGCGTGEMLSALKPARGVGVDLSPKMIEVAKSKFPQYDFRTAGSEDLPVDLGADFDYIIMVDLIEHLDSAAGLLNKLSSLCNSNTVLIASWYNPKWEPIIRLAEKAGLKMPEGPHSLISLAAFCGLLAQCGYQLLEKYYRHLLPVNLYLISDFINSLSAKIKFLQPFLFHQVVIFKRS